MVEEHAGGMTDVLIAGGGPVGLTLASDLARWGVSFRVFDKKPGPEKHSKAANLWPRSQEAAAAIGFLDRVLAEALEIRTISVHAFGRHLGNVPAGPYPSPYNTVLTINQGRIESLISEHLMEKDHTVEYEAAVVDVRQREDHVEATVEREDGRIERVRGRYLVACDGSKGAVREMAGLHIDPIPLPGSTIQQIDARLRWSRTVDRDHMWFFLFDDGFCGIIPLPGGHHRVFLCQDERDFLDRDPTLEEMQAALREISGDPLVRLSDPVWFSHGQFQYGVAPTFQRGRIFLAGDAGHMTIPIGGQGMNTGIQDAFNLGWKLAAVLRGRATSAMLESYSAERRKVRYELAQDQAANFRRLTRPGGLQKLAMLWFGPFITRHNKSVELGRRDESQLSINYPDSPLNEDHLGRGGVRAGDRAPDAAVVELPSLHTTTLFNYLYSGDWTLLAFDSDEDGEVQDRLWVVAQEIGETFPDVRTHLVLTDPVAPERVRAGESVLLDLDRFAHEAYRIKRPSLFLVRPDGHVAFRGWVTKLSNLQAYLDGLFVRRETERTMSSPEKQDRTTPQRIPGNISKDQADSLDTAL